MTEARGERRVNHSRVDGATALAIPCAGGDLAIHYSWPSLFTPDEVTIRDFWCLKDDDEVTFTTRADRLPPDFRLHWTEISGSLARRMPGRIRPEDFPPMPQERPGLWRLRTGDTLVFARAATGEVLMLEMAVGGAAYLGELIRGGLSTALRGPPAAGPEAARAVEIGQRATERVRKQGFPRAWEEEWRMEF